MSISPRTMAVDTFVPMLESLAEILSKGAAYAAKTDIDYLSQVGRFIRQTP